MLILDFLGGGNTKPYYGMLKSVQPSTVVTLEKATDDTRNLICDLFYT